MHLLDFQLSQEHQLSCRRCDGYYHRSNCGHETCQVHQSCATRAVRFHDGIRYWECCVDSNNCQNETLNYANDHGGRELCGKCCSHSGCNAQLCDVNQHVNTYSCLSCSDADTLQDCTHHESCDENHICVVRAVHAGHAIKFYGGCVQNNDCNHDNLTSHNPHRGTHQLCGKCCHGDNCNRDMCEYTRHHALPTTTVPISTTSMMKTAPLTTDTESTPPITVKETTPTTTVIETTPSTTVTGTSRPPTTVTETTPTTTVAETTPPITVAETAPPTTITETTSPTTVTETTPPITAVEKTTITTDCLSCYNESTFDYCETEQCHLSQICSLSVYENGLLFGGCVPEYACEDGELLIDDRKGVKICGECCKGNNCNRNLCHEYMTTTEEPTTTVKATTTTKSKTVPTMTTHTSAPTPTTTTTPTIPTSVTTTTSATTTTTASTTTSTTTTTPTTISTTTTSAVAPTTAAKPAVECEVCDGGLCGLIPGNDPKQTCPSSKPYCMNTVQNEDSGQKIYTKQ